MPVKPVINHILNLFSRGNFLVLVVLGAIVRFIYGYISHDWYNSPDQLAWGLGIDETVRAKSFSYWQLSHAPHEGGTVLLGIISVLLKPFGGLLPPLSMVALLADTVSRWIQINVAAKCFDRETALWFGAWTVFAVPVLLPWGTVNFGLHSLSSFFPFLLLYFASNRGNHLYDGWLLGIVCAAAISFSYDNIVLVPASLLLISVRQEQIASQKLLRLVQFLFALCLFMLPHLFARMYWTAPYLGEPGGVLAGRAISAGSLFSHQHWIQFRDVWSVPFPGAWFLYVIDQDSPAFSRNLVMLFVFGGSVFFLLGRRAGSAALKITAACIAVSFMAFYAFSSFYGDSLNNVHYVYYRHLTYIIPLFALLMTRGWLQWRVLGRAIVAVWIGVCIFAAIRFMRSTPVNDRPAYEAAGWILAKKYGSDPSRLFRIQSVAPLQYRNAVAFGIGWGFAAALLSNPDSSGSVPALVRKIRQSPVQFQPQLMAGVHYSFQRGITPVLDTALLRQFDAAIGK